MPFVKGDFLPSDPDAVRALVRASMESGKPLHFRLEAREDGSFGVTVMDRPLKFVSLAGSAIAVTSSEHKRK